MKKLFLALMLVCISAQSQGASDNGVPIAIQCSPVGPVFKGIMKIEMDIRNWRPTGKCMNYHNDSYDQREFILDRVELSFNNLTYRANEIKINVYFALGSNCDPAQAKFVGQQSYFELAESTSGYTLGTSRYIFKGSTVAGLRIQYGEGDCAFKFIDQ